MSESAEDGTGHGRIVMHDDLAAAVAERERAGDVRWVWAACADVYPELLRAGVRVQRCHDVSLAEALLLAREGRHAEPATQAAAWARMGAAGSRPTVGGAAGSGLAVGGAAAPAAQAATVRTAATGQAVLFEP